MSNYDQSLLAICPAELMGAANHLATAIGLCVDDLQTFRQAGYQRFTLQDLGETDEMGESRLSRVSTDEFYSAANAQVKQTVLDLLPLAGTGYQLPRPGWDTEALIDMSKAQSVFDDLIVWIPEWGEDGELVNVPVLPTDRLFVVAGVDPHWVFEVVGLALFESET